MKTLSTLCALGLAAPVQAAEWFCDSALAPGPAIQSDYAFRLVFADSGAFQAEGRRADRGFGWQGQFTRVDDQVAMIGSLTGHTGAREVRAVSELFEDTVLILSLQDGATAAPVMVRCLPHELG